MATPPSPATKVAVVVLNYNGLEDTLKCLESLRVLDWPVRVILVDNASRIDPSEESRRVYPGVEIIRTAQNLGYAGGNNRGIERALQEGAEYVLVLNNDTVVAPTIVSRLLTAFSTDPSLGIVGPVVNFLDEPGAVMTDGVAFNPGPGTEFFKRIEVPVRPAALVLAPVDIVNGCCMMIRREVLQTAGLFDERLFIVHEESDLCLKARRAGFGSAVLAETLVWHKGSSAFDRSGRQLQRYYDARNLWHLLRRHTGRVGRSRARAPSLLHYLKYVFYRYDAEREAGKASAAVAVADGAWDGVMGRYGSRPAEPRPGNRVSRAIFAAAARVNRFGRQS